jgi:AmiR/NasT family two-component response regulator
VIGLALGMLMTRHGMTHEETVSGLLRYSRRRHRKLRDLAAEVISLGDLIDFAEPGTAG